MIATINPPHYLDLDKIKSEAKNLTYNQLEIKIQVTCEQMHDAFERGDELLRSELREQRKIYDDFYSAKSPRY